MKKQFKVLLGSFLSVGLIGGSTIGGLAAYGKFSKAAKGWELSDANNHDGDFRLGSQYSKDYDYAFVDNTGSVNKKIGRYIPPKVSGNNNDYGVVVSNNNTLPVSDFINQFKNSHKGIDPLFTIKTSLFTFDNRYLTAVSADDWAKFVKWYVGDSKTSGHLSYGPEAGTISTFQIIPGVENKSGSVTLGGYSNVKKERATITFYPDAFFGSFPIYSGYRGLAENRLADFFISQDTDFSIDQIKDIVSIFNKINEVNQNHPENIKTYLQKNNKIFKDTKLENPSADDIKKMFGKNGQFSPNILSLVPSKLKVQDGHLVQKYKILLDFFTPNENSEDKKSLVERVAKKFPEILTKSNGYYIDQAQDGEYSLKNGSNKFISPDKKIGMAQILSTINKDFKGFGIDFLKYVSIHEYGHHETLINTTDVSRGGILPSMIHSKKAPNIQELTNLDTLNAYLSARSSGLKAIQVDALGNTQNNKEDLRLSPNFKFVYPDGKVEKTKDIIGDFNWDNIEKEWHYNSQYNQHRAFHNTFMDLKNNFVKPNNLKPYDAFMMNSFDQMSGTMNPDLILQPSHEFFRIEGAPKKLGQLLINAFDYYTIKEFKVQGHLEQTQNGYSFFGGGYSSKLLTQDLIKAWNRSEMYPYKNNSSLDIILNDDDSVLEASLKITIKLIKQYLDENSNKMTLKDIQNDNILADSFTKILKDLSNSLNPYRNDFKGNEEQILKNVARKYFNILVKNEQYDSDKAFFDGEHYKWITIAEVLKKIKDKGETPKSILVPHQGTGTPDIDLEELYDYAPLKNEVTKYDLIDPSKILIKNSKESYSQFINKDKSVNIPVNDLKKKFIEDILYPLLDKLFSIDWSVYGPNDNSGLPENQGQRPEVTETIFSDYVYQFPEVMTRDFVQITLAEDHDNYLSNTGDFLSLSQSGTSFEYYIDKSLTADYNPSQKDSHINEDSLNAWALSNQNLIINELTDNEKTFYQNAIVQAEKRADQKANYLINSWAIDRNKYLARTATLSNGFEADRAQRAALGWALYNDDGTKRTDDLKQFTIKGPKGETPTSWAEAYWFFILKMRGVGNRNITAFYRNANFDKIYMYGYFDKSNLNGQNIPKYLAFKNKQTGKITYQEIFFQNNSLKKNDPANTLFYLTHQGKLDSKKTLFEQGYSSWTTNMFTAGQYTSEKLGTGKYQMFFVNSEHKKTEVKLSLGNRKVIAENGKIAEQAPTKIVKESDGTLTFEVKSRFNGA